MTTAAFNKFIYFVHVNYQKKKKKKKRSLNVKCHGATGLNIYSFLLMLNSTTYKALRNLREIDFHLSRSFQVKFEFDFSRSLKGKCHGTTWLPIYWVLLIFSPFQGFEMSVWTWFLPFKVTQCQI